MNIRLKPHQKIHIQSSSDIYSILQPIFRRYSKLDRDREHLWMMTLDGSQTVRKLELLGLGTQRTVLIDPMEVYHRALLRRAASIVVIHNHPSGSLKPSRADKTATEKLVEASRFLNIKLLDHLIISPGHGPGQAPVMNISAFWMREYLKHLSRTPIRE